VARSVDELEHPSQPSHSGRWHPLDSMLAPASAVSVIGAHRSAEELAPLLRAVYDNLGCGSVTVLGRSRLGDRGMAATLPSGLSMQAWISGSSAFWVFPDIPQLTSLLRDPAHSEIALWSLLQYGSGRKDGFFLGSGQSPTVGYKSGPLHPGALTSLKALGDELDDTIARIQWEARLITVDCQRGVASADRGQQFAKGAQPQIGASTDVRGVAKDECAPQKDTEARLPSTEAATKQLVMACAALGARDTNREVDAGGEISGESGKVDDDGGRAEGVDALAPKLLVAESEAVERCAESVTKDVDIALVGSLDRAAASVRSATWCGPSHTRDVDRKFAAAKSAVAEVARAPAEKAALALARASSASSLHIAADDVGTASVPAEGAAEAFASTHRANIGVTTDRVDTAGAPRTAAEAGGNRRAAGDADNSAGSVSFDQLSVGQRLRGRVRSISRIGAFIDVGAASPGLLRPSRIAHHFVRHVEEVVSVGQELDVWVYRLTENGKLGLSMVQCVPSRLRDPVVAFKNASASDWFQAVVRYKHNSGLYVDVEVPAAGGHIQGHLPGRFLNKRAEPGAIVNVRVLRVHESMGTLSLSMKDDCLGGVVPRSK